MYSCIRLCVLQVVVLGRVEETARTYGGQRFVYGEWDMKRLL
jgi:hypothetical protein